MKIIKIIVDEVPTSCSSCNRRDTDYDCTIFLRDNEGGDEFRHQDCPFIGVEELFIEKYSSCQCQKCGAHIGWLGRFLENLYSLIGIDNIIHPCNNNQSIPDPPLYRVLREGNSHFCSNCGSTMTRSGFLRLFGKRLCDNKNCPNSKNNK